MAPPRISRNKPWDFCTSVNDPDRTNWCGASWAAKLAIHNILGSKAGVLLDHLVRPRGQAAQRGFKRFRIIAAESEPFKEPGLSPPNGVRTRQQVIGQLAAINYGALRVRDC
jgi:hypothetical protein